MRTFQIDNSEGFIDVKSFLAHLKSKIIAEIENVFPRQELKMNFRLFCIYENGIDGDFVQETKNFKTRNENVLFSTDLNKLYD